MLFVITKDTDSGKSTQFSHAYKMAANHLSIITTRQRKICINTWQSLLLFS